MSSKSIQKLSSSEVPQSPAVNLVRPTQTVEHQFIEELIREGKLKARYFGRARLVDRHEIDKFIDDMFADEQELPSWVALSIKPEQGKKLIKAASAICSRFFTRRRAA